MAFILCVFFCSFLFCFSSDGFQSFPLHEFCFFRHWIGMKWHQRIHLIFEINAGNFHGVSIEKWWSALFSVHALTFVWWAQRLPLLQALEGNWIESMACELVCVCVRLVLVPIVSKISFDGLPLAVCVCAYARVYVKTAQNQHNNWDLRIWKQQCAPFNWFYLLISN